MRVVYIPGSRRDHLETGCRQRRSFNAEPWGKPAFYGIEKCEESAKVSEKEHSKRNPGQCYFPGCQVTKCLNKKGQFSCVGYNWESQPDIFRLSTGLGKIGPSDLEKDSFNDVVEQMSDRSRLKCQFLVLKQINNNTNKLEMVPSMNAPNITVFDLVRWV